MRKIVALKVSFILICMIGYFGCSGSDNDNAPIESEVQQLSNLQLSGAITDVWGYADENTGKEYALVGFGLFTDPPNAGIHIVDVSDPENPNLVTTTTEVPGFDVKVWDNYMYTVNGRSSGSGGIVDLSDPTNPEVVGSFPTAHNIFIADGFMYLEAPGLRIFNLNASPTNPPMIFDGGSKVDGHDATVIDNLLYDFHGFSATNIYDVTDPGNPQLLTSINAPSIRYNHSGWPIQNGDYLIICDELAQHPDADFTIWDIRDLNNPQQVGQYADPNATLHNLMVIGDFAYTSYYAAGFRVFDISDPTNPVLVDEHDTSPFAMEGFGDGAFGVYPFAPSGNIYISDQSTGLHVFAFGASGNSNKILAP